MKQTTRSLTKREIEVRDLVIDGKSNSEIADILGIAKRTVEVHRQNLYIKLNIPTQLDILKSKCNVSN